MEWNSNDVANKLNKAYNLNDKSLEKLRYYIKKHELFKSSNGDQVEITEDFIDSLNDKVEKVRNELIPYSNIVNEASFELRHPIRPISGIYFLVDCSNPIDEQIVYVGQGKSIMKRLSAHFWKKEKDFDKVAFIEIPMDKVGLGKDAVYTINKQELDSLESYYIWHLGYPKYNKSVGVIHYLIFELLLMVGIDEKI